MMEEYTKSKITRMGSHQWDYWKVHVSKLYGQVGYEIHFSDDGECITDFVYTEADANLIAAAPLLLETLKCIKQETKLSTNASELVNKAINIASGAI